MKNHYFSIWLFLSLTMHLSAQNFPLKGNERWVYNQYQTANIPPGGCTIDTWKYYELKGDTMLAGIKWHRLFVSSYTEIYCTSPSSHSESFVAPAPDGLLRDSADVWMYRANPGAPTELLYAFGLGVGDLFFQDETCLVEEVSTTNTMPARRITAQTPPFSNGLATQVIEGVGSIYSFFYPLCFSCFSVDCLHAINLKCFKQDGVETSIGIFQDCAKADVNYQKILDYFNQSPTQEAPGSQTIRLQLSPNPAFEKLQLAYPWEEFGAAFRVEIIDQSGKFIFSQTYTAAPELDISTWNKGLYFVKVAGIHHPKAVYGRFVKM
ncbi:MAG: T9SS type A sorting domain-containing protein [Saprospiraceae bacterium]|nr:T9SS type A sorting domain-containing protein [Saprospiraceae bacterium]